MSENFIPVKGCAPRRLQQKEFKLPLEESIKIIDEVRKFEKYAKTIRPDENRKEYQNLLEWVNTCLEATKETVKRDSASCKEYSEEELEEETVNEELQIEQRRIIQTLMMQLTQMFKRECKQKSQLMQIIMEYFTQTINMYSKHYQKEYLDTLKNYNIQLQSIEGDYEVKLNQCNRRISYLQSEKETKWKNIYMLAKDNRILRRQKGKLLRMIQQQDQKIRLMENQLCQVVKENQTNKLVIRFESDNENLKIFMKNRLALMKFQKIIEKFPKKAMKVLNNDLQKLQIEELNSLDSKIDYIKRVITQSGDIFDQYEDLNELMTKPNKMVFNVYTQTDVDDLYPPKEFREFGTNYDMEVRLDRFQLQGKLPNIKIVGWPQMREKYVHMRNPNKIFSMKPISSSQSIGKNLANRAREYLVLQISSMEVNQWIQIKINKNSDNFNRVINTGVTYNPELKDKTKLYFVMPYTNYEGRFAQTDPSDDIDQIFKRTLPIGTKKQKQAFIRKSQTINQKQLPSNRMSTIKNVQKQRNSEAVTLQTNFSASGNQSQFQFLAPPKIQERTEFDSSIITQEKADQVNSFPTSEEEQVFELNAPKFKKKKRKSFRRGTQLAPHMIERSPTQKMSIFKEQKLNSQSPTSRFSVNIDDHFNFSKNQNLASIAEGSSTQRTYNKKPPVALNKLNRIKTTQNVRSSYIQNSPNKFVMDQIFEQPDQNNEDVKKFKPYESMNKTSRMSYLISPVKNQVKSKENICNVTNLSGYNNPNDNTLNGWEEETEGVFAERSQKYHATFAAINGSVLNRKTSKFAMRNSSFNSIIFKQQQQRQSTKNMDGYSIKSRISSQSPSTFNHKMYLSGLGPKKSFQILTSQVMNPVAIKNFEVKKLTEKIIRNMYVRRKQLLSSQSSTSLKVFTEHCLKQIYGNNWKGEKNLLRHSFSVEDRQSSSSIIIFNLMLNLNVQIEYLEDLFRLYVTMLDKNEFSNPDNPLITSKNKGAAILKYLLSVYFDQATANDIQQNLPFMNQYQIDLNQIFIVVQTHVRKYTVQTEMYSFLKMILPENQSFIEFGHMKELMYFFRNELSYHAHIARLKYFFKTYGRIVAQQQQALAVKVDPPRSARVSNTGDRSNSPQARGQSKQVPKEQTKENVEILPIHRVCLYLKRFQWTEMIEFNSHIEEKYHKLVGVFIQEESIKFITRYYTIIQQRLSRKKTFFQGGSININITINQGSPTNHQAIHPLTWLISRTKQIIRNYYRYKASLDRHLLMFVHMSILNYELDVGMSEVFSDLLGAINLEYKKIKTKEEVDLFMKD